MSSRRMRVYTVASIFNSSVGLPAGLLVRSAHPTSYPAAVPALSDVVRETRRDNACYSRHGDMSCLMAAFVIIKYGVPIILP